jgi:hypothetical protein
MRTRTPAAVGLAALVAFCGLSPAQEPKAELPPDVVPSTYRMFLVTDKRFEPLKDSEGKFLKGPDGKNVESPKNRSGKIHCLVCEYGLNPTVAIFVRADAKGLTADSGVGKLVKQVNALVPKYRADKLGAFVAFLRLDFDGKAGTKVVTVKTKRPDGTEAESKVEADQEYPDDEKRDAFAKDISDFETAVVAPNVPFGLAPEKSKANAAWKVADTDEVTVVFYHRMRIVGQSWRFAKAADLTDAKVSEIVKGIETALGKD